MNMRKIVATILVISAPLAFAACGEQPAETEETIVAEETVVEEPTEDATTPPADAIAPAAGDATEK